MGQFSTFFLYVVLLCSMFAPIRAQEQSTTVDSTNEMIGYSPDEGFRLQSTEGDYLLRFQFRAGIKANLAWTSSHWDPSGMFSYLRPIIRGNLYRKWIQYFMAMEWSEGTPFLLDGFVDIEPLENFGFIFGQQGTPVSRHNAFGPQQIFFANYAGVSTYFWSGRERGLTHYGSIGPEILDYEVGIYDGSPINQPISSDKNYVVEGRATINPMGPVNPNEFPFTPEGEPLPLRVSFTLQGYYGQIKTVLENYNFDNSILTPVQTEQTEKTGTLGADLWFQNGPAIIFGEYYWRRLTPLDSGGGSFNSTGAWGQILWNIYKNKLGLGVRFNWLNPNLSLESIQSEEVESQLIWFIHATDLTVKLRYAWLFQDTPGSDELQGFILPYIAGTSNVITLQFGINF